MRNVGIQIHSPLTSVGAVHSTLPSRAMWHMHAPTFNKWHRKKKEKEKDVDTPRIDTWRNARMWVDFLWWVALMTKFVI